MLEIKLKGTHITFYDLTLIDEGNHYLFDIELPKESRHKEIRSFNPVINRN